MVGTEKVITVRKRRRKYEWKGKEITGGVVLEGETRQPTWPEIVLYPRTFFTGTKGTDKKKKARQKYERKEKKEFEGRATVSGVSVRIVLIPTWYLARRGSSRLGFPWLFTRTVADWIREWHTEKCLSNRVYNNNIYIIRVLNYAQC